MYLQAATCLILFDSTIPVRCLQRIFWKEMKTWVSARVSHLESRNAAASGSSDSTGLVTNGLEDARVPRGCQRTRGTPMPQPPAPNSQPPAQLRWREGIPRSAPSTACTGTNRSRNNFAPALGGAGFAGRSSRARQAGAPRTRGRPSGAGSRGGTPAQAGARSRLRRPGRVSAARPPSPAPGQLCSA